MITTYPKFSANQVLKHKHLNGLFAYLDEQHRLSRTHLVGLGIVCGLEIGEGQGDLGRGLTISRGCGVTSEGHLLHWDNDDVLEFRRAYKIPEEVNDHFFTTYAGEVATQVPLWELAAESDGNDDYEQLAKSFLLGQGGEGDESGEKVLLLFLECRETDDANCGPNNCDDKGANVELTLKPLLARKADILAIRSRLNATDIRAREYFALDLSRSRRLSLPTLKMPRFDVANTRPATSYELFKTYEIALSEDFLEGVEEGLEAVYAALNPLIPEVLASPFTNFAATHAFLHDGRMLESDVAIYYQPWFDHIRTVLQAYTELKDRAEELYSLCCPDEHVFPRHLTLGSFDAASDIDESLRHNWVTSPVNGAAGDARDELRSLFVRLYLLLGAKEIEQPPAKSKLLAKKVAQSLKELSAGLSKKVSRGVDASFFAVEPKMMVMVAEREAVSRMKTIGPTEISAKNLERIEALSASYDKQLGMMEKAFGSRVKTAKRDPLDAIKTLKKGNPQAAPADIALKITPSHLHRPLSDRSLPGWYAWEELLEVWNFRRSRRGRSRETLGYRSTEWNANDLIVRAPLTFELEPRDFVRVEGILGGEEAVVLGELRRQVALYRLPIDVVGLRTGTYDPEQEIEDYDYLFGDLEAQFSSQRERMLSRLAEIASRLYDVRILDDDGNASAQNRVFTPTRSLFEYLTDYKYSDGTVGKHFEDTGGIPQAFFATGLWFYISTAEILEKIFNLVDALPDTLEEMDWPAMEAVFLDYEKRVRDKTQFLALRLNEVQSNAPGDFRSKHVDLEEVADQLDLLLDGGDRAALAALVKVSDQRRQEILGRKLLSRFQEEHPGLRYKAGTELGGTFVVVSHGGDEGEIESGDERGFFITGLLVINGNPVSQTLFLRPEGSSENYRARKGKFEIWVKTIPARVVVYERRGLRIRPLKTIIIQDRGIQTIDLAQPQVLADRPEIPGLEVGRVIANFYLPYRCCGKGNPIVIMPPPAPEVPVEPLDAGIEQVGCTKELDGVKDGLQADMTIAVSGGVPPYQLERQGNNEPLGEDAVNMSNQEAFAVVDSVGNRYDLLPVFDPLLTAELDGDPVCSEDRKTAIYSVKISGGSPGYFYFDNNGTRVEVEEGKPAVMSFPAGTDDPEVQIFDQYGEGCGTSIVLPIHECLVDEGKCNVPCEDAKLHTATYPLWTQRPPDSKHSHTAVGVFVEELFLCVEAKDGECAKKVELKRSELKSLNDEIAEILKSAGTLGFVNFSRAMNQVAAAINKKAAEVINPQVEITSFGQRIPALRLASTEEDTFDQLRVGYFQPCHDFSLKLDIEYSEGVLGSDNRLQRARRVHYTGSEAIFTWAETRKGLDGSDDVIAVPSFGRSNRDVCAPGSKEEILCQDNDTAAVYQFDFREQKGSVTLLDAGKGDRLFWDIPHATPPLSDKEQFSVTFKLGRASNPRLLVVAEGTGCHSYSKIPKVDGN